MSCHWRINYSGLYLTVGGGALPRWYSSKESACQFRRHKRCSVDPWVRKILWNRKWQSALVFMPGKFHGQRSLAGYSPLGHKELDIIEYAHIHTYLKKLKKKILERKYKVQ